jgi:hypothetical protein
LLQFFCGRLFEIRHGAMEKRAAMLVLLAKSVMARPIQNQDRRIGRLNRSVSK